MQNEYIIALGLHNGDIIVGKIVDSDGWTLDRVTLNPSVIIPYQSSSENELSLIERVTHSDIQSCYFGRQKMKFFNLRSFLKTDRKVKNYSYSFECSKESWEELFQIYFSNLWTNYEHNDIPKEFLSKKLHTGLAVADAIISEMFFITGKQVTQKEFINHIKSWKKDE